MVKRKFEVSFVASVFIEIDQAVIDEALTEDWAEEFYDFQNAERVAEHLAYNRLCNRIEDITKLDGFAHLKSDQVNFSNESWDDPETTTR